MRWKKAAAHFEMVIAFTLFVGFILFLFTVMKPYDENKLSIAALDGLYDKLEQQARVNYSEAYFRATAPDPGAFCFTVPLPLESFSYPLDGRSRVYIYREIDNQYIYAEIVGGSGSGMTNNKLSFVVPGSSGLPSSEHLRVSFSEEFSDSNFILNEGFPCPMVNTGSFYMGAVLERKVFSKRKLEGYSVRYLTDYNNLKKELGVPPIYDFSVLIPDANLALENVVPDTAEILAKDYVVELLDNESTLDEVNIVRMTLKIW